MASSRAEQGRSTSSTSDIVLNAGTESSASNASLVGSMPIPGRSYYKFRSSVGQSHGSGARDQIGMTPASVVTASHLDIREGSARLASIGLDRDSDDDGEGYGPDLHGHAVLRRASTGGVNTAHTPSGLSMLLQRHEQRKLSPVEDTSPPDAAMVNDAHALRESVRDTLDTSTTSSPGEDTVSDTTPLAGSPSNQNEGMRMAQSPSPRPSNAIFQERSPSRSHAAYPTLSLPSASFTERSPLLRKSRRNSKSSLHGNSQPRQRSSSRSTSSRDKMPQYPVATTWVDFLDRTKSHIVDRAASSAHALRKYTPYEIALACILEPAKTLPAVILGILMNLLDGVSYGMIMFPVSSPVFASFGGIGVSMFFASCFVSQIIFSSRSIFKGGNGSMMIEVVPFLHVIAFTISDRLGGMENSHVVIATTMAAYALTAILTGLTFFLLGYLRLGTFVEFFPRVVLVGCIGGVGAFLVITGIQVCAGLENEKLELSIPLIKRFFEMDLFVLWFIPFVLAAVLRIITSSRFNHPLVVPIFFIAVPIVFYIIVFAARIPMQTLRDGGWIFNLDGVNTPWYEYFTLYDFKATDWGSIVATLPTQAALVFFALLHVPINVPALALSVGEDNVETDRELVNHGLSNFLAGCVGSIPNYLVYTNSVLFYRVGGTTRLSSFMLAAVTLVVFLIGPWVIGYLPVMIVGTLIYILGYDLLKEAIWDTYGRVAGFDYATIWIIVLAMTYFDFVVGIGVGIVAACVSFVVVSSQRQPIRAIMSGASASSTVRRHPRQSAFLRQVGTQVRIIKLQSFLFFGTVVKVEAKIRELLDAASWNLTPIQYLILDFSLASGVDFSAAEAFLRIQRLLQGKHVILVLCGCDPETPVGKALRQVDLFTTGDQSTVRVFATLNDALEHCENSQLRSLYSNNLQPSSHALQQQQPSQQTLDPIRLGVDTAYRPGSGGVPANLEGFSPRRAQVFKAGQAAFQHKRPTTSESQNYTRFGLSPASPISATAANGDASSTPQKAKPATTQPLRIIMQSLSAHAPDLPEDFYQRLTPYFAKQSAEQGTSLWTSGDVADAFYVLESGILRAIYDFPDTAQSVTESMLPGTIAGEMTFLAGSRRNATVVAERDCVLWRMDLAQLADLEVKEGPFVARAFRQMLLRISAESADVLMFHLLMG